MDIRRANAVTTSSSAPVNAVAVEETTLASYEEWLEEHQGRDRGSEGERQLEGLREEHRHHHSDERWEEENQSSQPRSRRRFQEGDEQEENTGSSRATQLRTSARSPSGSSKPRTTAKSGRSK
jgi:hypothetical protein